MTLQLHFPKAKSTDILLEVPGQGIHKIPKFADLGKGEGGVGAVITDHPVTLMLSSRQFSTPTMPKSLDFSL